MENLILVLNSSSVFGFLVSIDSVHIFGPKNVRDSAPY